MVHFAVRRNPSPTSTAVPIIIHVRPAAVVRGDESGRRVVNPRPAPRIHPSPMTISVRCPVARDVRGNPDRTEITIRPPGAVLIEVFRAGKFGRNVTGGLRALFAKFAIAGPLVEGV